MTDTPFIHFIALRDVPRDRTLIIGEETLICNCNPGENPFPAKKSKVLKKLYLHNFSIRISLSNECPVGVEMENRNTAIIP